MKPTTTRVDTWSANTFMAAVGEAVWAPSIHNSQPWRFRLTLTGIDVLLDQGRVLAVCDPTGRAARVSCGAATLNLRLALAAAGEPATVALGAGPVLAHLSPAPPRPPTPAERRLYRAIRHRHTNRYPFVDTQVPPDVAAALVATAHEEDGWLDLATAEASVDTIAALTREADRLLHADPAYMAELSAWTRSGDSGEGVTRQAGGTAPHPSELMTRRDFGGREVERSRDDARLPVLGVLGAYGDQHFDEVQAGMALQRVLLAATDLGLATAFFSQPIEVPAIRERLRLALHRRHDPQMVLRFGYAPSAGHTSRRPVTEVVEPHE